MGFFKGFIILVLALIAIAHFFPTPYNDTRNWLTDKISEITTDSVGKIFAAITNFARVQEQHITENKMSNNVSEVVQNGTNTTI